MTTPCQNFPVSYKTTNGQYEVMLAFMQEHGDLCAPSGGAKNRGRQNELWTELTSKLNQVSTGYTKTSLKWIKVWCDWKTRTKKKMLYITMAGKHSKSSLTDLETQLMTFLGWNNANPPRDDKHNETKHYSENVMNDTKVKPETAEDNMNMACDEDDTPETGGEPREKKQRAYYSQCVSKAEQPSSSSDSVDYVDLEKSRSSSSRSHCHRKKIKHSHKNTKDDPSRILYHIFKQFSRAEERRLQVDLLKQRNEARRQKITSEETLKNHMDILQFTEHLKITFANFMTIYSKNVT